MARIPGGAFDSAAVTRLEDSQLCWHPPPILGSITCYARTVEDALQTNVWYWCGLEVENIISHLAFDRNWFYPLQQHVSLAKPLKPVCLVLLWVELLKAQLFEGTGLTHRSILCTLHSP